MRLLLDTAVIIYAVESPEKLTKRAASALRNLDNALELSAVSVTEIAIKAVSGKLEFPAAVLRKAVDDLGIRILPFTSDHAFRLFDLPVHHRDPFDRQIIAQALSEDIAIITPDREFSSYNGLKLIW